MSAPAATPKRTRAKKPEVKKSFWQMDIGKGTKAVDDVVDHPPFVATLPRVDLLPPAVGQSIALRKVRRTIVTVLALLALAAGGLWYVQGSRIDDANAALAQAQAESTAIQAQMAALAPIKEMYLQINSQKDLVRTTMASQPQSAAVFSHLSAAATEAGGATPVDFSSVSIVYQGIPKTGDVLNACANPDPFGSDISVGCVAFEATAGTREQVSALLRVLAADPMFIGPYVDSSTISTDVTGVEGKVVFSGTSGISTAGLEVPLTDEEVQAILNPPKPADDTTEENGAAS